MSVFGYEPTPTERTDNELLTPETNVPAKIEASKMTPTKNNPDHEYLYVEFLLLEGHQAGRKAFLRLNLKNSNQDTVTYARKDFDSLIYAIGFEPGNPPQQDSDLVGGEILLTITVSKPKEGKEPQNNFRFKRVGSVANIAHQTAASPFAAKPAATGGASAPWKKQAA
jgi:Protein of unknown function (DUF669)